MLNYSLFISSTGNFPASQGALVLRNPPANAGDIRDVGSIPGWGRFLGEGHGNPFPVSLPGESLGLQGDRISQS